MKKVLFTFLFTFLVLVGCNQEESAPEDKEKESQSSTVESEGEKKETVQDQEKDFFSQEEKVPETSSDLINQPAGKYAGKDFSQKETKNAIAEEIKDMPVMTEEAPEEEVTKYFQYAYSRVAEDFADPQDLIGQWEFSMSGDPELPDSKYQFKENYNIEVMLDASGSMANVIDGKTMMEHAKASINEFLAGAPEDANVSLRVYGHKGTGSDADKEMSCSSIEQLYGYEKYDEGKFNQALSKLQPAGWTPIAGALEQAEKELSKLDPAKNTNLIYMVSDGVETCGGDPVKIAESLGNSDIAPIINIIGFNVDSEAQQQLKDMARKSNGTYTTVHNGQQLQEEFNRADEILKRWEDWKKEKTSDVDSARVDQSFDIMAFYSEWGDTARSQFLHLSDFLSVMKDEGKITVHQKDELKAMSKEVDKLAHDTKDEIREDLDALNTEKAEEMKKKINEKYSSQVN